MNKLQHPFFMQFPKHGNPLIGYISLAEKENLPFEVQRVYWSYFTPQNVQRGAHAHLELEQILVAVSGKITVTTEMPNGSIEKFILESPDKAVFLPKLSWHVMEYSHNAVQMCIASMPYEESDYIRNYSIFKNLNNNR